MPILVFNWDKIRRKPNDLSKVTKYEKNNMFIGDLSLHDAIVDILVGNTIYLNTSDTLIYNTRFVLQGYSGSSGEQLVLNTITLILLFVYNRGVFTFVYQILYQNRKVSGLHICLLCVSILPLFVRFSDL
jgi:hypothetical protein